MKHTQKYSITKKTKNTTTQKLIAISKGHVWIFLVKRRHLIKTAFSKNGEFHFSPRARPAPFHRH